MGVAEGPEVTVHPSFKRDYCPIWRSRAAMSHEMVREPAKRTAANPTESTGITYMA